MAGIPVSARNPIPSLLGATHARMGALREKSRSGPCALPAGEHPWQSWWGDRCVWDVQEPNSVLGLSGLLQLLGVCSLGAPT